MRGFTVDIADGKSSASHERFKVPRFPACGNALPYGPMPICKACGEDVETLVSVKVAGKAKKVCEDCADRAREEDAVAEASESVVQNMMGFKGRR
jgi:hypothetical protein